MLNNLTNFFNLITGRQIKTQLENSDLFAVGTKDSRFEGGYKPSVIKFEDLQAQLGGLQSVTVDPPITINNTDPENPVIGFSGVAVDGATITGTGLAGNPLVANIPGPEYKVWTGILRQTGTGAPTVRRELKNTLTNPITFGYVSTGQYSVACADITGAGITTTNTFVLHSGVAQGSVAAVNFYGGFGTLRVYNHLAAPVNDYMLDMYLEIRIY